MFDLLRNLAKPAEQKRRERLNAYLDGALSAQDRRRFEKELAGDPELQAELAGLQQVRAMMRQMPRVRPPRNFTLDPAAYGRPAPDHAGQWYPVLRTATALAAIAFVFMLALNLFLTPAGGQLTPAGLSGAPGQEAAMEMAETTAIGEEEAFESVPAAEESMVEEEEAVEAESAAEPAPEAPGAVESAAALEMTEADEAVTDAEEAAEGAAEDTARAESEPAADAAVTSDDFLAATEPATPEAAVPASTTEATPAPLPTAAPVIEEETAGPDSGGFAQADLLQGLLILLQVALGAGLVALVVAMLVLRRRL